MKANAPEKIYVKITYPISDEYTEMIAFEDGDGVEYTRTDAFIEKAVERLKHYLDNSVWVANDVGVREKEVIIEDFENYLKGE